MTNIHSSTVTNGFLRIDDAAVAILMHLIPISDNNNVEYGGYIYKKDDQFYFTNPPVKGSGFIVDVHLSERLVPDGAEIVGDYHTHFLDFTTASDNENANRGMSFSQVDIEGIKKSAKNNKEYRGYLGTQEKSIQVFAPHASNSFYTVWINS
jgi:hypothetical protein